MRRILRRALTRQVRQIKSIVNRLDPEPWSHNSSSPGFAYASINKTLLSWLAEKDAPLHYPQYTWGVLQCGHLAKALGIGRIAAIELGVAGGNGLVALELAAEKVEALYGVQIEVHGFDSGRGLPRSTDLRDTPHLYQEAEYHMDFDALRRRLRRAHLHLGLVAETLEKFLQAPTAPIAFVSFDLDLYTSTMDAFTLFEQPNPELTLPRVHCYFDDIMGFSYSQFTGERLAIEEFNAKHEQRKISPIYGLKYFLAPPFSQQQWSEMFYLAHIFDHPLARQPDGLTLNAQRPLAPLLRA